MPKHPPPPSKKLRGDARDRGDRAREEADPVDAGAHGHRGVGAEAGLGRVLGVWHEPHDVARLVRDARDVAQRTVGVDARVAEGHEALALDAVEGLLVGDVAAVGVLERDDDLLPAAELVGPRRVGVLDRQLLVATDEVLVAVADESAGQQVRLDEHLEAVADAEHGQPLGRGILHLGHDRRERGDGAGAQVVAVAESAGQHEGVDTLEVVRAVPEGDGLGAGDAHGALRVAVVERAREGDDPDAYGHSTTSMPTTSSITEFDSTSSAMRVASASSSSVTSPSTVSSKRLPMRTSEKPSTPRRANAP